MLTPVIVPANRMKNPPVAGWRSRRYLVQKYIDSTRAGNFVRLSVQRVEHAAFRSDAVEAPISWDELMVCKAEVGYADQWAVEVYPAAEHVVDVARMRHLFVVDLADLPFAWLGGARLAEWREQAEPYRPLPVRSDNARGWEYPMPAMGSGSLNVPGETRAASYGMHVSRGWNEDPYAPHCGCPLADCGLVLPKAGCVQHDNQKTIRNAHMADECPAAQSLGPADDDPADTLPRVTGWGKEHARNRRLD